MSSTMTFPAPKSKTVALGACLLQWSLLCSCVGAVSEKSSALQETPGQSPLGGDEEGDAGQARVGGGSSDADTSSSSDGATGAGGADSGAAAGVTIRVSPESTTLRPGASATFTCKIEGSSNSGCSWKVQEGSSGGAITSSGAYTAPTAQGTYHVVATSQADSSRSATATVVVPPVASGKPGVWENVTDSRMSMDENVPRSGNFGALSVLADPVRPNELYASVYFQGVWKSTDYGLTWDKVNTGTNGDKITDGGASMALATSRSRDPKTFPTLYSTSLYGASYLWKSVDGGVNWTNTWTKILAKDGKTDITAAVGTDLGAPPAVDPEDPLHIITGIHGNSAKGAYDDHVFETTDGGATWVDRGSAGIGALELFFVNRTTWLAQGDYFGNGWLRRTTNSGDSWTVINSPQIGHAHGGSDMFKDDKGNLYVTGIYGLYYSEAASMGQSWKSVESIGNSSTIVATPTTLYTSYGWATAGTNDPNLWRMNRATGKWTKDATPSGMTNGGLMWAVTSDGEHNIVLAANWLGGLWRYVEP